MIDFVFMFQFSGDYLTAVLTIVFGSITVFFSCGAYKHTKEKFRLELFEKRWISYEATLEFFNILVSKDGAPDPNSSDFQEHKEAWRKACYSFRGKGLLKSKALFGKDVEVFLNKLNDAYNKAEGLVIRHLSSRDPQYGAYHQELNSVIDDVKKLREEFFEVFRPYIYFGNYKV